MAQITDVLTRLIERTSEGKVPWQTTTDEQTFVAVYGKLSALIQIDDYDDIVLKILKSGNEIERLDSTEEAAGKNWEPRLASLHQMARRVALRVEDQLDELLVEIDGRIDHLPF